MTRSTTHVPVLPLWGTIVVTAALAAGFVTAALLGLGVTSIVSGILAVCIAYSSYGDVPKPAFSRAIFFSLLFIAIAVCGVSSTGIPWLAAIAMAVVAFLGSVLTSTGVIGLIAALLSTTSYVLLSGFSLVFIKDQGQSMLLVLSSVGIGALVGVAMSALMSFVSAHVTRLPNMQPVKHSSISTLFNAMSTVIREFRRATRDGVRRAVALGLAMFIFQTVPTHDGFLLLITTAIVLPVYGRVTLLTVGGRLLASLMAIGIALTLPFLLPRSVVTVIAILIVVYALATALRSTTHSLAAAGMAFLLLIGAPGTELGIYAGWRLIDVAAGFLIAWICGYVVWPKQPLMITPIPSELHKESEAIQLTLNAST